MVSSATLVRTNNDFGMQGCTDRPQSPIDLPCNGGGGQASSSCGSDWRPRLWQHNEPAAALSCGLFSGHKARETQPGRCLSS